MRVTLYIMNIKVFAYIALIIALYYLTTGIYEGIVNPIPALGDSWSYHIPISQTIPDGRFLFPRNYLLPEWYYPASAETFNALLMFLHVPLTLSNIFPIVLLFFALWKLGRVYGLEFYFSLLFALTIVTLNLVVRWLNAVSVDMWIAAMFTIILNLLVRPKKSIWYFLELGTAMGMFIGSKYPALLFLGVLLFFFGNRLWQFVTIKSAIAFLIPFSILGLFWYARNYVYTGNPFYPLEVLGFPGVEVYGHHRVWTVARQYPIEQIDAFFAEYKLWLFAPFIAAVALLKNITPHKKLLFIGFINLALYPIFPSAPQPWIMVSVLRYSLPAFIPLILGVFILAQKYQKQELLSYFALGNMIMITSFNYHPKLTLIYVPVALLCMYFIEKKSKVLTS